MTTARLTSVPSLALLLLLLAQRCSHAHRESAAIRHAHSRGLDSGSSTPRHGRSSSSSDESSSSSVSELELCLARGRYLPVKAYEYETCYACYSFMPGKKFARKLRGKRRMLSMELVEGLGEETQMPITMLEDAEGNEVGKNVN